MNNYFYCFIFIIVSSLFFSCSKYYEATDLERAAFLIDYFVLHQEQHFKMVSNKNDTIIVYARNITNEFRKQKHDGLFTNKYYQFFQVGFYNYKDSLIGYISYFNKPGDNLIKNEISFLNYGCNHICNYYEQLVINNVTYRNVYELGYFMEFDDGTVIECPDDRSKIYTSEHIGIIRVEKKSATDTVFYDYCFDFKNKFQN